MNWITYVAFVISVVSAIFMYLNVRLAYSATIHAILQTHEVERNSIERCPGNKFGPEMFLSPYLNGPSRYLNLIIINDGPGVAKKIEWNIEKKEKDGTPLAECSNELPYIGKGATVNVKGYLEVQELVGEENEFSYHVNIIFRPILFGRKKGIYQQFNAYGELKKSELN